MRFLLKPIVAVCLLSMVIIFVNEYSRARVQGHQFTFRGRKTIHPKTAFIDKCSWTCYYDTRYCKDHHVTMSRRLMPFIDPVYFGVIRLLNSSGNYIGANILLFVLLFPATVFVLWFANRKLSARIHALKQHRYD